MKRIALIILLLPIASYGLTLYSPFDNRCCSNEVTKGPGSYGVKVSDNTYRDGRLCDRGRSQLYPEYKHNRCTRRVSPGNRTRR